MIASALMENSVGRKKGQYHVASQYCDGLWVMDECHYLEKGTYCSDNNPLDEKPVVWEIFIELLTDLILS